MFDPITLPLRLPVGAPFPVDVVDAIPSLSQFRMLIEVPYDTWDTIDVYEAFNLKNATREAGSLGDKSNVRIELRLADAEVPDLIRRIASLSPSDGVAELAQSGDDAEVLMTENWFALHVTQAVELPPELQSPGAEVWAGFSTSWASAENLVRVDEPVTAPRVMPPPADEPWPELLEEIRLYLDASEIAFERHQGADMVSAMVQGNSGVWSMWVHSREAQRQVLVYSIRPEPIDEADRPIVNELIGRLNVKMLSGNFEMDPTDGGFRCRGSIIVNANKLSGELLDGLIPPVSMAMDSGLAALNAVLNGTSVDDALSNLPQRI